MIVTIQPRLLTGDVHANPSKSYSHRYIIAAALAKGKSHIQNVLVSDDLTATKEGLMALGAQFEGSSVIGNFPKAVRNNITCKESGSTLRFLIPLALLTEKEMTFSGDGRLPKRPINLYEDLFTEKGIFFRKLSKDNLPLVVNGPLKPGNYQLKGNISSQFVSGLLFALPLLKGDSKIILIPPIESNDYILMTIDVLQKFGIQVKYEHQVIYIPGNQNFHPTEIFVEGDYSQAAFWMVAATIGKHIDLYSLNQESIQGDKKIVDIISEMGGLIEFDEISGVYHIKPVQTKAITIDLSQIPDLGPILMMLAALSEGITTFLGIERLKFKESNRLDAMMDVLHKFGVKTILNDDMLQIYGQTELKGNQVFSSFQDHRIVMAIAIGAIRAKGSITILDAEVVKKSYPDFFEIYEKLGGIIDVN
ncbi:MAG: 3-phosphoshikimate 1-carboxyvinyltransferase [Acholeplasmataceae bacterium]